MTTKTASRKSMRPKGTTPVRKSEPQGTTTTRKPKAPKVTTVAEAVAAYGSITEAVDTIGSLSEAFAAASETVARWAAFSLTYSGTMRAFSIELVGDETRKNLLGRLRSTAHLLAASREGKGTRALTPAEATKVANTKSAASIATMCEEMRAGGDPLNTRRHAEVKPGARSQGGTPNASRKAKALEINANTLVEILDALIKVAPKVNGPQAVEGAKRAATLQGILAARAVSLAAPVKGTRKATA